MTLAIPTIASADGAETLAVDEQVFGQAYNEALVHQLVTRFLAGARAGTRAQKNRSAVAGGGRKPWRQKGSGRARAGTISSPLFRSGGVTFAAQPQSFEQKLNKKMYRAGLRSILSELLRQERLFINDGIVPDAPKTKRLYEQLKDLPAKRILLVTKGVEPVLELAARNLPHVQVATAALVDPVSLVGAEQVIATRDAIKALEERLG